MFIDTRSHLLLKFVDASLFHLSRNLYVTNRKRMGSDQPYSFHHFSCFLFFFYCRVYDGRVVNLSFRCAIRSTCKKSACRKSALLSICVTCCNIRTLRTSPVLAIFKTSQMRSSVGNYLFAVDEQRVVRPCYISWRTIQAHLMLCVASVSESRFPR